MSTINWRHRVQLYHFTDKRNVSQIRMSGGLLSLVQLQAGGVSVPATGGNQWSHDADAYSGVDDYVHLCLKDEHPMEYVARRDGRIGETIFLRIDTSVLEIEGVKFSSDVSNKSGAQLVEIADAEALIDFDVLYTYMDWRDSAVKSRRLNATKCEVLVPKWVPLNYIRNL